MRTATLPLTALTAADLMTPSPMVIPQHMSLRTAAHLLTQAHVTGAPVVNEHGVCVGVISATDILRYAECRSDECESDVLATACFCADWQVVELEMLPLDEVAGYMSRKVFVAGFDADLPELARIMVGAHVHRIIIVDGQERPIGIVSTMDILAAVAEASDNKD